MKYSFEVLEKEREMAMAALVNYNENREYYDETKDQELKLAYYKDGSLDREGLKDLLVATHKNQLNYSPHRHVYPWVDLQENGQLKSLYSGKGMDPVQVIEEDIRILEVLSRGIESINSENILVNCEHVVPQSWFDKKEPMRGDLHHLFACEPTCNSSRSNYPYHDFEDYIPERSAAGIKAGCGKSDESKFEPEYGKGIVARATLYFLLRYEGIIDSSKIDLALLLEWHQLFPVSTYEKHRNQAIHEMQGNRNPYIDFPEMAEKWN
ncbi:MULTISPECIES: endonuclease [Bacillaceae]|uniref:endonuclease I family protein n=1 Tax=Bacillaceae TaxID=186817 RepID=UPI000C31ECC9|nr:MULTISPECIES: endonuclease [Bacillaceae]PKF86434.1 endonuclease I [Bacillus sp. BA3]CAH0135690.1 Extracellular ribonuclease [Peribacillus sp. Bi134]